MRARIRNEGSMDRASRAERKAERSGERSGGDERSGARAVSEAGWRVSQVVVLQHI